MLIYVQTMGALFFWYTTAVHRISCFAIFANTRCYMQPLDPQTCFRIHLHNIWIAYTNTNNVSTLSACDKTNCRGLCVPLSCTLDTCIADDRFPKLNYMVSTSPTKVCTDETDIGSNGMGVYLFQPNTWPVVAYVVVIGLLLMAFLKGTDSTSIAAARKWIFRL